MSKDTRRENHDGLSVCKYHERDIAELHSDTVLNDDMLFSTIMLSKEIHNDERCIVACSFCNDRLGQQLHVFDGLNDELIKSRVIHKKENSKVLTAFDVFLISCSISGNIVIVDARTGGISKKLKFNEFEVEEICVHGNSTHSEVLQIVMTKTEDVDNKIYVLDAKTEKIQFELAGHQAYINTLQIAEQLNPTKQTLIISTSDDMTCRTWLMDTGKPKNVFRHKSGVTCAHYYPNGTLITGCQNGSIHLWKEHTTEFQESYQDYASPVTCIESHQAADMLLIIGYEDGSIRIWDASSKECLAALFGHKSRIRSLCPTLQKEPKIVSCSNDGEVKMWGLDKLINDYFTSSMSSPEKKRNDKAAYRVDKGNTVANIGNDPSKLPPIDTSSPTEIANTSGTGSPKKGARGANNLNLRPSSSSSKNVDDDIMASNSTVSEQQPVPPSVSSPSKKPNSRAKLLVEPDVSAISTSESNEVPPNGNEADSSGLTKDMESLDIKMKQSVAVARERMEKINESLSKQTVSPTIENAESNTIEAASSLEAPTEYESLTTDKKSFLRRAVNFVETVNKFSFGGGRKKDENVQDDTNESPAAPVIGQIGMSSTNSEKVTIVNTSHINKGADTTLKRNVDNGDVKGDGNFTTMACVEVKEDYLDKSFPIEIAKLHPNLPPLSPVIKRQYRESSVASFPRNEHSVSKQLDFGEKRDSDVASLPLSPEKKEIADSLSAINETLKSMKERNRQMHYVEEQNNTRGSNTGSEWMQYANEEDNLCSFSSQTEREDGDTKIKYKKNKVDYRHRVDLRQNKERAARLEWEIEDPELYILSESDDEVQ